ncbi:uncharacterized protein M6B38_269595 [Iris pallida]|nr:uncharacterized protein M6B38_269595 [Iris pallida]
MRAGLRCCHVQLSRTTPEPLAESAVSLLTLPPLNHHSTLGGPRTSDPCRR